MSRPQNPPVVSRDQAIRKIVTQYDIPRLTPADRLKTLEAVVQEHAWHYFDSPYESGEWNDDSDPIAELRRVWGSYFEQVLQLYHVISQRGRLVESAGPEYNGILEIWLISSYGGVSNKYLRYRLTRMGLRGVRIEGEPEPLEPCPCCGYKTRDALAEWNVCPVCYWEFDGSEQEGQYSGLNEMTVGEGRRNFRFFGAAARRLRKYIDADGRTKYQR